MKRIAKQGFVLLLMMAVLISAAYSQQKIGVVDSQQVLENSIEGKKVMSQLQRRDKEISERIANLDEEIRQLETRLNTQRLTLTDAALAQLSSDLDKKRTSRKRFQEDSIREMQELTARLFQRIQNELMPIIETIGKDMNLEVIFDLSKSGAIYYSPAADITQEVIRRYDASKSSD